MPENHDVSLEDAKEQVRKVCRRLALLHLAYVRTLVKNLGDQEGKKQILEAIKEYGQIIGQEVQARANDLGLENTPDNYIEDLPLWGMYDWAETVQVDGGKNTQKLMVVLWVKLGWRLERKNLVDTIAMSTLQNIWRSTRNINSFINKIFLMVTTAVSLL